jgi:RecA-family ATPase
MTEPEIDPIADYQKQLMRMMDPSYLHTVSMDELYETVYRSSKPIIEGLLYPCTYLFVGAPKLGKSFMMAQFAYHVSTGTPLWNFSVQQGDVLYLALEDDYRRLQNRLYRMFGAESTEKLHFAVTSNQLNSGLDKQLEGFLLEHPDTKLIIIDTLQKVREVGGADYSYSNDYQVITRLKQFSDNHGICLLLVHHTRKQKSDDNFDMISGTNGLLGAADGAFLLQKDKRTSNTATLEISGRDQQDQKLMLRRNPETLLWELERSETELWKEPPDPILTRISEIVTADNPEWQGSPTDLVNLLSLDIQPNTLTKKLNINAAKLLNDFGIQYESRRTHDGRIVAFHRGDSL